METIENDWADFIIPSVTENDYGLSWPEGTPQLVKELKGFYYARIDEQVGEFGTAFEHGLRAIQLLWDDEFVSISRNCALNTYFLDVFSQLCKFKNLAITGPASSAKTYTSAIFLLLNFYMAPDKFAGLISTTSGTSSERRVWADVKRLHRNVKWEQNNFPEIGEILEYLKLIVYNPAKIAGENYNIRDFRNGILVIPVGSDASGEQALDTIAGTKNDFVSWMIDEGPMMPTGIMDPIGNLIHNPYFQFIMVGNANLKTDPHGRACEPRGGWGTIDPSMKRWEGKTMDVLFLHGEKGPNDIYFGDAKKKKNLPYPRLSNRFSREEQAFNEGDGNVEAGKNTHKYWRMSIGYWMGSDIQQTILSEAYVKSCNADRKPERWGPGRVRTFAGFDPAFTSGGDSNAITFAQIGRTMNGSIQCLIESASIEIKPLVTDRKEYSQAVAERVVQLCKDRNMNPEDLAMDVSGDGGITADHVSRIWALSGIQLLSSLMPSSSDKYANRVAQYWWSTRLLMATGAVCGFNCNSNYANDLFQRRYAEESNVIKLEKKKDLKKRIMRSPDCGDSFTYLTHAILQSGLLEKFEEEDTQQRMEGRLSRYFRPWDSESHSEEEDGAFAVSLFDDE